MKLNVFFVPDWNVSALKAKFDQVGLKAIHTATDGIWETAFYFSSEQTPAEIPWVSTFAEFFAGLQAQNLIYFGAYVFEQPSRCYVLTYGKAHFYVRPFCDHDFGIEVAKRIADEDDIKQKASKRFAGRRKKEIGSYTSNTRLDIESGESVDYLQAGILDSSRKDFGRTAKFGSSVLLNAPIDKTGIGKLLDKVTVALSSPPTFALPRTAEITDAAEVARYDVILLDAIASDDRSTDFTHTGPEIVGVNFVFSGNEQYTLTAGHHRRRVLGEADLDLDALRDYIKEEAVGRNDILGIRIKVDNEGQRTYSKTLKDSLDYIVDGENVMLSQGRWLRFNENYVDQLNNSVDGIAIEPTEPKLEEVSTGEPAFNDSSDVAALGYVKADKDFSKIQDTSLDADRSLGPATWQHRLCGQIRHRPEARLRLRSGECSPGDHPQQCKREEARSRLAGLLPLARFQDRNDPGAYVRGQLDHPEAEAGRLGARLPKPGHRAKAQVFPAGHRLTLNLRMPSAPDPICRTGPSVRACTVIDHLRLVRVFGVKRYGWFDRSAHVPFVTVRHSRPGRRGSRC